MTETLFPEHETRRVEITKPEDLARLNRVCGLAMAQETLEAVPESRRAPGFAYALALIEREVATHRAEMIRTNLVIAQRGGVDIARVKQMHLEGTTLVCTPYAPGEGEG